MTEISVWNAVLGPFYARTALERWGIEPPYDDLIGLTTAEGSKVYPHAQFNLLPDGNLSRRQKVIELWNGLILPSIQLGDVDEWTSTGLLLQSTGGNPSRADIISSSSVEQAEIDEIELRISRSLSRFRQ
ncbi:MAG TPA: hypothetical protein VMR34_02285 [Candidatus Saccharimonadales bacterium]|nr:hypothetical protein [Candidatus Saccharimonadales bacterium]